MSVKLSYNIYINNYIATSKYPSLRLTPDLLWSLGLEFALPLKLSKGIQEHDFWPKNNHQTKTPLSRKNVTLEAGHYMLRIPLSKYCLSFSCYSFSFPQESLSHPALTRATPCSALRPGPSYWAAAYKTNSKKTEGRKMSRVQTQKDHFEET